MEELIAQLSRIANAMEAQNAWNDKWFEAQQQELKESKASNADWIRWNKRVRAEDQQRRMIEHRQHMEQQARAYEQALVITEAFTKDHPELIQVVQQTPFIIDDSDK